MANEGSMIIFSSHRMEHVELFCKKIVIILKGKTVLEGYLSDIKTEYRKKNIRIKADITKNELEKIDGVDNVSELSDEFIVSIQDEDKVSNVFDIVKDKKNVTKFVVEEPSLNEIFVEKVGESFEK